MWVSQFDELKVKTHCHFMSDVKGRTYYVWHLPGRIYLFYQTAWQWTILFLSLCWDNLPIFPVHLSLKKHTYWDMQKKKKKPKQIQILCKYCYATRPLRIQSGSDSENKTSLIHWSQFLQGNNVNKIPQTCVKGILNHRWVFHMSAKSHTLL